jgi:hypothetical protein
MIQFIWRISFQGIRYEGLAEKFGNMIRHYPIVNRADSVWPAIDLVDLETASLAAAYDTLSNTRGM